MGTQAIIGDDMIVDLQEFRWTRSLRSEFRSCWEALKGGEDEAEVTPF
jgi:hypothetical protein